jgi:hypothetical protein
MNRVLTLLGIIIAVLILAACHEDNVFHWVTPEPVPVVEVTPDATAEAIEFEEAGQVESACLIKVNVNGAGELIYHMPEGAYYDRVKVDEASGDSYACTEEEAIAAGARKSTR